MRIAFITDEIPRPGRAGYLTYSHALLAHLVERGHTIRLVLGWPRLRGPTERFDDVLDPAQVDVVGNGIARVGGRVITTRPKRLLRALGRRALAALPPRTRERLRRRGRAGSYGVVDAVMGRMNTEAEARIAAGLCAGCDLVMTDAIFRAPALAFLPAGPRRAIITHDVFHLRHATLSARGLSVHPPRFTASDEAALLANAGLLVAIQEEEAAVLRRLAPTAQVVTAPMPAAPHPRPHGTRREPGRIVFVGSIGPHNVDALRWFAAEAWPGVRALLPDARLDVVGSVGGAVGPLPEGMHVLGVLPSLAPVLHRASVAVAPMQAGSGLNIKLLDYAAHGLATVCTSRAAAGLLPAPDWPFAIADTPQAFATAVARLAAGGAEVREEAAAAYLDLYGASRVLAPLVEAVERG